MREGERKSREREIKKETGERWRERIEVRLNARLNSDVISRASECDLNVNSAYEHTHTPHRHTDTHI